MSDLVVATSAGKTGKAEPSWQEIVERQVRALQHGSIQIAVHNGQVVRIETSVKVRVDEISA